MKIIGNVLTIWFLCIGYGCLAQVTRSIHEIQYMTQIELQNCRDTSAYFGDTVRVIGVVLHDGNLTEAPSNSVVGGYRPLINIRDTANFGLAGDFSSVQVHGIYFENQEQTPIESITELLAGDLIEVLGYVGYYKGETMIFPLDSNSIQVLSKENAPTPKLISIGELNDSNSVNQLGTGEKYEGEFVVINNVTVQQVYYFSGGSRVSFYVRDEFGNSMVVSDRFLIQKLNTHSTVNPNSLETNGDFDAPQVGDFYSSISGIINHSINGCPDKQGVGYEINPFKSDHYAVDSVFTGLRDFNYDNNSLRSLVYPNPLIISSSSNLTFSNLPQTGLIQVYHLSGRLIKEIHFSNNTVAGVSSANLEFGGEGTILWRLNEFDLFTGSYIYNIQDLDSETIQTGKFLIIK